MRVMYFTLRSAIILLLFSYHQGLGALRAWSNNSELDDATLEFTAVRNSKNLFAAEMPNPSCFQICLLSKNASDNMTVLKE